MKLFVANLTPFDDAGRVDVDALQAHVAWMVAQGVDGFAPTGTSGEFLYLSAEEKAVVHRAVLEAAEGHPVMPCVWDPQPATMIALAQSAADAGAHAVFLSPPLYHPVSEAAVVAWYTTVTAEVDLPVYGYHHPRVGNPIDGALLQRLRDEAGVVGMKDSSGDPARVIELAGQHPGSIYAGGDGMLGMGDSLGDILGHFSRLANLYPELAVSLVRGPIQAIAAERDARLDLIAQAGGIPAMKHLLGFGARAPLDQIDGTVVKRLPPPSFQR